MLGLVDDNVPLGPAHVVAFQGKQGGLAVAFFDEPLDRHHET